MFNCTNVRGHYGRGRHAVPEKGDAKARQILPTFVQSLIANLKHLNVKEDPSNLKTFVQS